MRILGLDLSLRSTGYVLLDEEDVVWHGAVGRAVAAGDTAGELERLQMFDTWIRGALSKPFPVPANGGAVGLLPITHVAIEGYSYASKQTNLPQLGELGGIIKLAVHQVGIPVDIIAPGTWKKVLFGEGKGGLKKDLVRLEIFKRYGVEFASQDTLDAWAVAMCLRRQLLGLDKPEPKVRKRKSLPLLEGVNV